VTLILTKDLKMKMVPVNLHSNKKNEDKIKFLRPYSKTVGRTKYLGEKSEWC
jgi:hypothetical protein